MLGEKRACGRAPRPSPRRWPRGGGARSRARRGRAGAQRIAVLQHETASRSTRTHASRAGPRWWRCTRRSPRARASTAPGAADRRAATTGVAAQRPFAEDHRRIATRPTRRRVAAPARAAARTPLAARAHPQRHDLERLVAARRDRTSARCRRGRRAASAGPTAPSARTTGRRTARRAPRSRSRPRARRRRASLARAHACQRRAADALEHAARPAPPRRTVARHVADGLRRQHAPRRQQRRDGAARARAACRAHAASSRGVQAAGAAERDQREVARVVAALDRDHAERALHRRRSRRARRPAAAASTRAAEPARQRRAARARARATSSRISPPRNAVGHETAEQRGRRRSRSARVAAAVAGRPGIGAGALGPDPQRAAGVEPRDRAAAGADGVDVDRRHADRQPADRSVSLRWRGSPSTRLTSVDVPPMSSVTMRAKPGAPRAIAAPATPPAGPESTVRTGSAAAVAAPTSAAVRLHHPHAAARAASRGGRGGAVISGPDVRVHHRRRERSYSRYSRSSSCDAVHVQSRGPPARAPAGARGRAAVGVQETDRDRLARRRVRDRGDGATHGIGAPSATSTRPSARTRSATPTRSRARHQRLGSARLERVELGPRLPADLEHVLEAARGEQHHAGAAALEQRVGRDRRPVVQQTGSRLRRDARRPSATARAGSSGVERSFWTASRAADERDEVGEGAAGVDSDDDRARASGVGARPSPRPCRLGLARRLRLGLRLGPRFRLATRCLDSLLLLESVSESVARILAARLVAALAGPRRSR